LTGPPAGKDPVRKEKGQSGFTPHWQDSGTGIETQSD